MEDKNDIEKIEEQIKQLKNDSEEVKEEKLDDIIQEEVEVDNNDDEITKKIDNIDEIEEKEDNEEIKEEITDIKDEEKEEVKEEIKEESDEEDSGQKKKGSKKKLIIIISSIVLLLIILGIILLLLLSPSKKKSGKEDVSYTKSEQKEILQKFGDAVKGIIAVYSEKKEVLLDYEDAVKLVDFDYKVICDEHEIYEDGSLYLNKCKINNYKTTLSYGKKQEKKEMKISEDAIKVYVSKNTKKATLKEPSNKDDYNIYGVEIKEAFSDLMLLGEKSEIIYYTTNTNNIYTGHMIQFKTGTKALDGINYQSILPIKLASGYETDYAAVQIDSKWGVYNLINGNQVLNPVFDSVGPRLILGTSGPLPYVEGLGTSLIATYSYSRDNYSSKYGVYDYKKGYYVIADNKKNMLKSGDYLWVVDEYNSGHVYDYNGTEILKNTYSSILGIVDGKYILVNDRGRIKLVGPKKQEYYDYGEHNLYKVSNYGLSYNNGAIFQFTNPKREINPDYDGKTDCIEVIYNSDKTGEYKESACGGIAKPVLYLYPKKTTKVEISFENPEILETTYPKFNGKWEVTAHKNGDLIDNNNKYYYALYWDEVKVHSVDFSTGFYVEDKDAIKFLEEKLDIIGLNKREKNEFIMYWLPILEKNKKNLVYFELTEERESYNKLIINPKPDSLLRVVIHIKKVDQYVEIKEEKLKKFKRSGFSAVEWGGTTY